jgi:hypothetical protein
MIKVPFPHMALNTDDVPGTHYKMWNTWDQIRVSESPGHILDWVAHVAAVDTPGGHLETLIINCHGYERKGVGLGFGLALGAGIQRRNTPLFSKLRDSSGNALVKNIWITACGTASISIPTLGGSLLDGDGNLFCCEIAKQSGAYVTAATTFQYDDSYFGIPYGYIDNWEGLILTYGPLGNVVSFRTY